MNPAERSELERTIRGHVGAGDLTAATTAALRGYGPEVFRFLIAFNGSETAASDVFSLFAEAVWCGIEAFDWEHPFRSWAFGIARRASLHHRRDQGRRALREIPIEAYSAITAIAEEVRTRTLSNFTERKNRFTELQNELPVEDRALLILRVEQQLSWNDCARARHDGAEPLDGDALKREAARLRKRFQVVKERLLEIGRSEGLVSRPG